MCFLGLVSQSHSTDWRFPEHMLRLGRSLIGLLPLWVYIGSTVSLEPSLVRVYYISHNGSPLNIPGSGSILISLYSWDISVYSGPDALTQRKHMCILLVQECHGVWPPAFFCSISWTHDSGSRTPMASGHQPSHSVSLVLSV